MPDLFGLEPAGARQTNRNTAAASMAVRQALESMT
jgi:hypothetical protein